MSTASSLFSASALRWSDIGAGVESKRKSARGRYHDTQFPSRSCARSSEWRLCKIQKNDHSGKRNRFLEDLTLLNDLSSRNISICHSACYDPRAIKKFLRCKERTREDGSEWPYWDGGERTVNSFSNDRPYNYACSLWFNRQMGFDSISRDAFKLCHSQSPRSRAYWTV